MCILSMHIVPTRIGIARCTGLGKQFRARSPKEREKGGNPLRPGQEQLPMNCINLTRALAYGPHERGQSNPPR